MHTTSKFLLGTTCLVLMGVASAAEVDVQDMLKQGVQVGPVTPYGELKGEAAAKKIMFEFVFMNMIERKPAEAFEKYVSKGYCNHSHLSTKGVKSCADYEATKARWVNNWSKPAQPGEKVEFPQYATVNGEMVTMYGAGVDIFRVHDGKITDHWDASPPAEVDVKAHSPEATAKMNKVIQDAIASGTAVDK